MTSDRTRRALHTNVGRRGAALLGLGVADVLYAVSLLDHGNRQSATVRWFATIGPVEMWVAMWFIVAAICFAGFATGFIHPRSSRHWAFFGAVAIKAWWLIMCLLGWFSGQVSIGSVGVWFGFLFFVALIAGWPEPASWNEDRLPGENG